MKVQRWSPADVSDAAHIWQQEVVNLYGDDPADVPRGEKQRALLLIAKTLRKNIAVVEGRYRRCGPSFVESRYVTNRSARYTPQTVLAERTARQNAGDGRDLTGQIFGDPPPGYSALDRRRR